MTEHKAQDIADLADAMVVLGLMLVGAAVWILWGWAALAAYVDWCDRWLTEVRRVLAPRGSAYVCAALAKNYGLTPELAILAGAAFAAVLGALFGAAGGAALAATLAPLQRGRKSR